LGDRPNFAALDKIYGRINDNLIALIHSVVDLYLRTQIPRHRYLADMYGAILNHGYL
jgi:hypothetical protein